MNCYDRVGECCRQEDGALSKRAEYCRRAASARLAKAARRELLLRCESTMGVFFTMRATLFSQCLGALERYPLMSSENYCTSAAREVDGS